MTLAYDGTYYMENAIKEIVKTLGETIAIVNFVVFPCSWDLSADGACAARGDAGLAGGGVPGDAVLRVLAEPLDDSRDRSGGGG